MEGRVIEVSEVHPENARSGRCVIPSGRRSIALPSAAMLPRHPSGRSHDLRSLNEATTTGPLPTGSPPSSAASRSMAIMALFGNAAGDTFLGVRKTCEVSRSLARRVICHL